MQKTVITILSLFAFISLSAQNLAGTYTINGQGGTITLQLSEAAGAVQGTLTDMQGVVYQAQAEVEDGEAFGTLSTQQGSMYFEAFREGNELYFTLIPVGANGQPDPSGAQEFVMTATGAGGAMNNAMPTPNTGMGNKPSNNSAGGPLGGPIGGQPNSSAAGWNGTYSGNLNGTPMTMQLQVNGSQLSGMIDASGYRYNLQGSATGTQSQGKLLDTQTQGSMSYTAKLAGNQLNLTIQNPMNGQSQQVIFQRGAAAGNAYGNSTSPGMGNNQSMGNAGQSNQQFERDSRIVGSWTYTDSYTSGDYGFVSQWKLIVNADGSYLYGDGRVVGGGPGISGDSGGGGDVTRGQWRTENGIIHINTGAGWQPYARYTTNGESMLMQFGDGSKQLWKRSY